MKIRRKKKTTPFLCSAFVGFATSFQSQIEQIVSSETYYIYKQQTPIMNECSFMFWQRHKIAALKIWANV